MKWVAILTGLLVLILLAQSALAMSSTSYKLDWFTPLTTNGGGAASSANYAINLTVGQSAIGASASAGYATGMGYWYGVPVDYKVYLPLVMRQ